MAIFCRILFAVAAIGLLTIIGSQAASSNSSADTKPKRELIFGGGDFSVRGQKLIFLPDGKRVFVGGGNCDSELREVATGLKIRDMGADGFDIAVSPDGSRAVTAGRTITVWDLKSNKEILTMPGNNDGVMPVAFSPDGNRLAIADNSAASLAIIDINNKGKKLLMEPICKSYGALAFTKDGTRLAAGGHSYGVDPVPINIFDSHSGKKITTLNGHNRAVRGVAFSNNGDKLASIGHDGVGVWNVASGVSKFYPPRMKKNQYIENRPWSMALSPDGKTVAVGADNSIMMISMDTVSLLREIHPVGWVVSGVAFSSNGSMLGSVSGGNGTARTMEFWNPTTGAGIGGANRHAGTVQKVEFLDADRLASYGDDSRLKIWNIGSQSLTKDLKGINFKISPGGKKAYGTPARLIDFGKNFSEQILSGIHPESSVVEWFPGGIVIGDIFDQKIVRFDLNNKQSSTLKLVEQLRGLDFLYALSARNDGKEILFGGGRSRSFNDPTSSGFVGIWQPPGTTWKSLSILPLPVHEFVTTTSGKILAIARSYNDYSVFDAMSGKEVSRVPGNRFVLLSHAMSPNGRYLAFGGENSTVLLWDTQTKNFRKLTGTAIDGKPQKLPAPENPAICGVRIGPTAPVEAVAFSPDGSTFASTSTAGGFELWSVSSGKLIKTFDCKPTSALAFAPDGKRLAAGLHDGTIHIWDVSP